MKPDGPCGKHVRFAAALFNLHNCSEVGDLRAAGKEKDARIEALQSALHQEHVHAGADRAWCKVCRLLSPDLKR